MQRNVFFSSLDALDLKFTAKLRNENISMLNVQINKLIEFEENYFHLLIPN